MPQAFQQRLWVVATLMLTIGAITITSPSSAARCNRRVCDQGIRACVSSGGRKKACKRQVIKRCKREGLQACVCSVPFCGNGKCCSDPQFPTCSVRYGCAGCTDPAYPVNCPDLDEDGEGYCCPAGNTCGKNFLGERCFPPPDTVTTTTTQPGATTTTLPPIPTRTVTATISNDSCTTVFDAASVAFTVGPGQSIAFAATALSPDYFFCWSSDLMFIQGSRQIGVSTFRTAGKALLTLDDNADTCESYRPGIRLTGRITDFPPEFNLAEPFTLYFDHTFCRPQWCGTCEVNMP